MTWSGHVHLYERTCPILFHECLGYSPDGIPNAPVHMAIGNGGVSAPQRQQLPSARQRSVCPIPAAIAVAWEPAGRIARA